MQLERSCGSIRYAEAAEPTKTDKNFKKSIVATYTSQEFKNAASAAASLRRAYGGEPGNAHKTEMPSKNQKNGGAERAACARLSEAL
jgi:hypothetical protein